MKDFIELRVVVRLGTPRRTLFNIKAIEAVVDAKTGCIVTMVGAEKDDSGYRVSESYDKVIALIQSAQ